MNFDLYDTSYDHYAAEVGSADSPRRVCATNYLKQEVDMIRRNSGTGGIQ